MTTEPQSTTESYTVPLEVVAFSPGHGWCCSACAGWTGQAFAKIALRTQYEPWPDELEVRPGKRFGSTVEFGLCLAHALELADRIYQLAKHTPEAAQ